MLSLVTVVDRASDSELCVGRDGFQAAGFIAGQNCWVYE